MKTLKKALCLVLALVMLVGTLAISVSADDDDSSNDATSTAVAYEDLTDTAEITDDYELAVKILVALQIINGYNEDKTFRPQGTLSRQEAAKIICVVAEGIDGSKAYNDTTVTTGFTDVDSMTYKWAVGYIAYGVSEGILAGKGDNKFDPTGTLTGYEFEKMLLCALNYDADVEGLVGSSWKTRTTTVANIAGLLDGLKNYNPAVAITREQAAQIAFNTLFSEKVSYATSSMSTNLREYTGEWLINEVHDAITATDWAYLTSDSGHVHQGVGNIKSYVLNDLVDDTETDGFGIPTGQMTLAGVSIENKAIPVYTWTSGSQVKFATTMKSKYSGLSGVRIRENGNAVNILNTYTTDTVTDVVYDSEGNVISQNVEHAQTSDFVLGAYDANKTAWSSFTSWDKLVAYVTYAADCAGTYVEVYEMDSETLYVIVKTATFAHVSSTITSATTSDEVDSIAVKDLSDKSTNIGGVTRNTTVYEGDSLYTELKQNLDAYVGAYIQTTTDQYGENYTLIDVEYLTSVTGSPSYYIPNTDTYTKYIGTLTFEGATYQAAKESDMSNIAGKTASEVSALSGSTLYVDKNGAAYGIVGVTVSSGTKYAYVSNISTTETSFGSGVYAAQIIKAEADAVPEVVNVQVPASVANITKEYANKIVTYTVSSDGTYSLTAQTTNFVGYSSVAGTGTKSLNITTTGSTNVATLVGTSTVNYADSNTTFIVINGTYLADQKTGVTSSKVYKGISNVPTLLKVGDGTDETKNMYVAYLADGSTNTRLNIGVIINSKSDTGMAGVYFISVPAGGATKTTDLTGSYYTYNAVVDSELTTIKVNSDSDAFKTLQGENGTDYNTGFYKIESTNSDGQVLTLSAATEQVSGQFKKYSGNVLSTVENRTDETTGVTSRTDVNYVCAADVPVFVEKSTRDSAGNSVSSGKIAADTASNLSSSATYVTSWADEDNGTATQSTGKTIYYYVDTNGSVTAVFIAYRSNETDRASTHLTGTYTLTLVDGVTAKVGDDPVVSGGSVYQGKTVVLTTNSSSEYTVKITYTYIDSYGLSQTKTVTASESSNTAGQYTATFTMPAYNVTVISVSSEAPAN